jgi:AraC family transcriptional regulator
MTRSYERFRLFFIRHPPVRTEDAARMHIVSAGHYRTGPDFELARPQGHTVEHLIYTVRGAAVGEIAGQRSRATAGSIWLMPKDRPYGYRTDPKVGYWEGRWIEYDGAWARSLWALLGLTGVTHVPGCWQARPIVEELFACLASLDTPELHDATGLLWRTLATAERALAGARVRVDTTQAAIERTERYVRDRLAERITLKDLARAAALSPFHFARTFRQRTGVTPAAYVRAARIGKAKELLRQGELSVKQVGHAVGYPTLPHFSAVFKQGTGLSPRGFAKLHRVR